MRATTALRTITGERITAGTCLHCGFVNADAAGKRVITCDGPRCGQRVALTFVRGYVNGEIPCDDRCQYATGEDCSCSCGGANHRAGYIRVEIVPAWVRERDAERHTERQQRKADKRAAAQAQRDTGRARLLAEHPDLAALESDRYADTGSEFVDNVRRGLANGYLSPGRVDAALRMIREDRAREAAKVADQDRQAAARAAGASVPTGRLTVPVTIVRNRFDVDYRFTYHGRSTHRMLVRHADGWQAWGTVPAALEPNKPGGMSGDDWQQWRDSLPGRAITLTATFTPGADPLTGRFSSPRAEYAPEPAAAPPAREPADVPATPADPWTALLDTAPTTTSGADPWAALLGTAA